MPIDDKIYIFLQEPLENNFRFTTIAWVLFLLIISPIDIDCFSSAFQAMVAYSQERFSRLARTSGYRIRPFNSCHQNLQCPGTEVLGLWGQNKCVIWKIISHQSQTSLANYFSKKKIFCRPNWGLYLYF